MNKIIYMEKRTTKVLNEKRYRPQSIVPQRHDYVNIGNVKWCVDCREFTEESSFDGPILTIVVWLFDDTALY